MKQNKWDKLNKELDDALEEEFGSEETKPKDIFENAKSVLRKHLFDNKAKIARDLEQMREWSNTNKQETLEEAALSFLPRSEVDNDTDFITGFEFGAKWQSERSYSEEEIQHVLDGFTNEAPGEYIKTNFIDLLKTKK